MLNDWDCINFFTLPVFSDCFVFGNTDIFTFLFLDGGRNFPGSLNTFLVAFFLHLEISYEGYNVMANILTGFLVSAKFCRLWFLTFSFGRATGNG